MITGSTVVVHTSPRINAIKFGEVLLSATSPALVDSYQIYDAVAREGVDPTFLLAIFAVESAFGTKGFATANRNPGNTRSSITGKGIIVNTTKGLFVRYPNWLEGFKDLAARLVEPDYIYGRNGYRTIAQIIPVFAPKSDSNNPDEYIASVVKLMNAWISTSGGSTMFDLNNIPFQQSPNYTAQPNSMKRIVIHTTMGSYGSSIGWLLSPAAQASAHYIISEDGSACTQLVHDNEVAWHTGNWDYNLMCIGIEHSWFYTDHEGTPPDALLRAGAALTAKLCRDHNIPIDRQHIIRHGEIPPPNDHTDPPPAFDMDKFMGYVNQYYIGGATVSDFPNPPNFPPSPVPEFNPNPNNFNVGPGVIDAARSDNLTIITNEDYFTANAGEKVGQRSFTYVQDKDGVTYQIEAVELVDGNGNPTGPWKRELWKLEREYD